MPPFSYVGSKFKCLQLMYYWKGSFIRTNIVLTRKYIIWAIDRKLKEYVLKSCVFC